MANHVVVVGYGRAGPNIVDIMGELGIPYLVIDSRIHRIERLSKKKASRHFWETPRIPMF